MASSTRVTRVHYVLAICVLISVLCGLGWLQAHQQKQAVNDLKRDLAARIYEMEKAVSASRQEADEYRESTEVRINELAGRVAYLTHVNEKLNVDLYKKSRAGHGEAFSIIGIMDLDGDGKDNRDQLKTFLAALGDGIDNDVDDKGILRVNGKFDDKPKVTERTKFVVIGEIPEIADTDDANEIAAIQRILRRRNELVTMARERGVGVVSLSDFLKYIGYKLDRRPFVPGSDVPYRLKSS